jgi:16S rRNA (guanine1207-N2)-methyltransferase
MKFGGRALELQRIPEDPDLQAWDQADLYALDHLTEPGRLLIVLDAFGALACALHGRDRLSAGDSEISRMALGANLARNGLRACGWADLDSIEGIFDQGLVKIPRQRALLDAALARVRPHLREGATVIGAGMTRHIHNSTSRSFERWIGPTTTSRARSRARLLFAEARAPVQPPVAPTRVEVPGERFGLWLEPGVFAKTGIDPGSGLLAKWIPRLPEGGRDQLIVDAGCGSGLLAATGAARNPQAGVLALDESHLAVRSAVLTLEPFENAAAQVADVMQPVADGSADLVLSNPPQHQAAALSRRLLARFIEDARRVLRPGGRVRMVSNRHVNLNVALSGAFDRVRILDQDRRFMVCEAEGPLSAVPRTA